MYLLSCNVSEILVVAIVTLAGAPLPLTPLQLLVINLVTDVFPALALALGEGEGDVMRRPPRPRDEPVLTMRAWRWVAAHGGALAVATLAPFAFLLAVGSTVAEAATAAFLTLAFAQLWHVLNLRDARVSILTSDVARSPLVLVAVGTCAAALVALATWPPAARVMDLAPLSVSVWGIVLGASLLPLALGGAIRAIPSFNP
jgi:Ca2+-transporting ATPase